MNPPLPDPVIDEIREIRHRISASFGHDPAKFVAYLMEYQKQFQDRLIYAPSENLPVQEVVQPNTNKAASTRPAAPVLNP
ncbi:MAG: hypothetical protein IAG10_02135 [Planctomycetaceae bacterium]|nr:hypothetical protein [Planctomycetaceae bacterium]